MVSKYGAAGNIVAEVLRQRNRDVELAGSGSYELGTRPSLRHAAVSQSMFNADAAATGELTWRQLVRADYLHAFGLTNPAEVRDALINLAATVIEVIEDLDRRSWDNVVREATLEAVEGVGEATPREPEKPTDGMVVPLIERLKKAFPSFDDGMIGDLVMAA